jgi:GT2 family glycosyltransferase
MRGETLVFAAALRGVERVAALSAVICPARPRPPRSEPLSTLSILIPERGTPDLLGRCLDSTAVATSVLTERTEVVVALNGCERAAYRPLMRKHPHVRWCHSPDALGFGGAVALGLASVEGGWLYLLNSDMTLAPNTLSSLLPLRDRYTFAIASQIHFTDPARRREETGWTDFAITDGLTEHFDREPEDHAIRGHLYAGGGASLFQTALLRRFSASTRAYAPFYFEDADWGVQAARLGLQVKFCPASRVWHAHRGTIGRFFAPEEIARIVRRNQLLFESRHGFGGRADLLRDAPRPTRRELTRLPSLAATLGQRWRTTRAVRSGYSPGQACASLYPSRFDPRRPNLLVAIPAAQAHPRGSRELDLTGLLSRFDTLADHANVELISDHDAVLAACDPRAAWRFAAIHSVASRGATAALERASHARACGERTSLWRHVRWWRSFYRARVRVETAEMPRATSPGPWHCGARAP